MPCLAHEHHHRLPATNNHCKSLSCLLRETYAHCRVPCLGVPAAGWSSGDDSEDDGGALDTKQVILNEMRNRETRKRSSSRCGVDSPTLSSAFAWSFTRLHTVGVLEKVSSSEKEEKEEAASGGDEESEAFFSVKSFFTRSTSRAATVASWTDVEGFRDCEGWPFGLCRRPAVPPLPSTPADSWKWRKRNSSSNLAVRPDRSPAPQRSPVPVNQTAATSQKEELSLSIKNGTPKLLVYNGTQELQMK